MSEASKTRLRAGWTLQRGKGCTEVALPVGVARQTVYTWKALLDKGGIDALRAVPGRGRPAKLDEGQLASVRAAILQSPTEHGFGTELWNLKRVGDVIERLPCEAVSRTNMRFVALKTPAQQAVLSIHRARRDCLNFCV